MNGQLAVVEERRRAPLVCALVLQLPRVNHGLVGPKPVPRPILFPAKRAHVRSIGLPAVRTRFVGIDSVLKVRFPVFSEGGSLFEYFSAALEVAGVLLLVRGVDVSPQLILVVERHLEMILETRKNIIISFKALLILFTCSQKLFYFNMFF